MKAEETRRCGPCSPPRLEDWLAAVDAFAERMKRRIREEEANGRKEWSTWLIPQLLLRLGEETAEVGSALSRGLTPEELADNCANAANYNMIIAEIALRRGLAEAQCLVAPRG